MLLFFDIRTVSPLLLKCTRVVTVQNVFLYHHQRLMAFHGFVGSCDFFGLNYYTSRYVTHKEDTSLEPQHLAELCDAEDHVDPQWEV